MGVSARNRVRWREVICPASWQASSAATAFAAGPGHARLSIRRTSRGTCGRRAFCCGGAQELFRQKVLLFHISGGTTDLLLCQMIVRRIETLGTSTDLYAGQAVDRVGVKLGFGFPAGCGSFSPWRHNCTERYQAKSPVCRGMQCSLSGLENQCNRPAQRGQKPGVCLQVLPALRGRYRCENDQKRPRKNIPGSPWSAPAA